MEEGKKGDFHGVAGVVLPAGIEFAADEGDLPGFLELELLKIGREQVVVSCAALQEREVTGSGYLCVLCLLLTSTIFNQHLTGGFSFFELRDSDSDSVKHPIFGGLLGCLPAVVVFSACDHPTSPLFQARCPDGNGAPDLVISKGRAKGLSLTSSRPSQLSETQ